MAHPKRRQSHTRGAKRRTHYKAETPNVTVDPVTGTMHVMHRAYYVDGDLYYRGQLVMAAKQKKKIAKIVAFGKISYICSVKAQNKRQQRIFFIIFILFFPTCFPSRWGFFIIFAAISESTNKHITR